MTSSGEAVQAKGAKGRNISFKRVIIENLVLKMPRGRPAKKRRDRRQGFRLYKAPRAVSPGPASTGSESEKNLQELASEIEAVNNANPSGNPLCEADIEAAMARIHSEAGVSDDNLIQNAQRLETMQGTSRSRRQFQPEVHLEESEGGIY